MRRKIDLEGDLIVFAVAIHVVGLRGQLGGFEGDCVLIERGCGASRDDCAARRKIGRDALEGGHRNDDVLGRAGGGRGIGYPELDYFDARGGLRGKGNG